MGYRPKCKGTPVTRKLSSWICDHLYEIQSTGGTFSVYLITDWYNRNMKNTFQVVSVLCWDLWKVLFMVTFFSLDTSFVFYNN